MTHVSASITVPAHASGTFAIGGRLTVHRLGFGAMRLPGVRDRSVDSSQARAVLREAVRLGVDLIDTAHIYGPPRTSSPRRSIPTPRVW